MEQDSEKRCSNHHTTNTRHLPYIEPRDGRVVLIIQKTPQEDGKINLRLFYCIAALKTFLYHSLECSVIYS
jgi:hypothetical protein